MCMCMCVWMCSVSEDSELTRSRTPHKDAPWRVGVQLPSGRAEKRAPQVARSEAEGRGQWGRLFFGYFLLAKQKKVTRLPGRHPGSGLGTTARYPIKRPVALTPTLSQREREREREREQLRALTPHGDAKQDQPRNTEL